MKFGFAMFYKISLSLLFLPAIVTSIPNPLVYPIDTCAFIENKATFDFIVVGAGTAGSTVASRLTEISDWKVLLIEAGSDPSPLWAVPSLATQPDTPISWDYKYAPASQQCLGMIHKQCDLHRARTLGGCSVVNLLLFVRGNRADWDEWEGLGNDGWAYRNVLPYFKKLENYIAYPITKKETNLTVSSTYHSTDGPIDVNLFPLDPFTANVRGQLYKAGEELGLRRIHDFNGKHMVGYGDSVASIDAFHLRLNAAKAYLSPAKFRKNFQICKRSLVTRVLFEGKRAVGVEFISPLGTKKVYASKEVILSGGSISTPPILERSGIGQKKILKRLGVDVVQDLPGVGENLQDVFLMLGMAYTLNSKSLPIPNPFAITLTNFIIFANTTSSDGSVPDVLIQPLAFPKLVGGLIFLNFGSKLNYLPSIIAQYTTALLTKDLYVVAPAVLRQKSRGSVHSYTADPLDELEIIGNHFTDYGEIETMIRGIHFVETIFETKELAKFKPEFFRLKECDIHEFRSDEYWMCMMMTTGSTLYHPVGTTKMGPRLDPLAVVDNKLRVHGIDGLRIIDAGVMPIIPRGHTNGPTYVVAEMGADIIKKHYIPGYEMLAAAELSFDD